MADEELPAGRSHPPTATNRFRTWDAAFRPRANHDLIFNIQYDETIFPTPEYIPHNGANLTLEAELLRRIYQPTGVISIFEIRGPQSENRSFEPQNYISGKVVNAGSQFPINKDRFIRFPFIYLAQN